MSFVISRNQQLAPKTAKPQYKPLLPIGDGLDITSLDVPFGHPLYTILADINIIRTCSEEAQILPIVPDGCMSLTFVNDGENTCVYLCGVADEIRKIVVHPGQTYIIMRFLPGAGRGLLNESAANLTNQSVSLMGTISLGNQLALILEKDMELLERIGQISRVLRINYHSIDDRYLLKHCVDRIIETHGDIKVETLAEETGFTSRHIGREFENYVGISPKFLSQIMRLQQSMGILDEDKDSLLVHVAVDCGFFDHAHMNREYKKLIHISSGEYRKKQFGELDYSKIEDYITVE